MGKIFNPYRYFIIPSSDQYHIDHYMSEYPLDKKALVISDLFLSDNIGKKHKVTYYNHNFLIYIIKTLKSRYVLLKLAKEKQRELHQEGEFDIEEKVTDDYPYIYIIIDLNNQVILIEHLTTVFNSSFTSQNIIKTFLLEHAAKYHYEIKSHPMLISDSFWESVQKAEAIHELQIKLESPNLFDGMIDINTTLKKIKKKYNNTETNIKLVNNSESLLLQKENEELKSAINYVANGGGDWVMSIQENNHNYDVKSEEHIQIIVMDSDPAENFNDDDSSIIVNLFKEVKDVINDEKEQNEKKGRKKS